MTKKANPRDPVRSGANDWPPKPRWTKAATRDQDYAPFDQVVGTYSDSPELDPPAKAYELTELAEKLCPSGRLTINWSGQPVPWQGGLGTLCNPESPGALGRAASDHSMLLFQLYKRWTQLEGEQDAAEMYQERQRLSLSDLQDAQIMPFLPICRREYLSLEYVTGVLKPYAHAIYACRQMFWQRLKEGHCRGDWLCFLPAENGSFYLLVPGTGFDGQGNYEIDRTTYLSAFGLDGGEIPIENYPATSPRAGQDKWMFVAVDEVLRLPPEPQKKPGRKAGSGYDDDYFVQQGLDLIAVGEVSNAHAAAKMVLKTDELKIKGASYEAKLKRLREKIDKRLRT